MDKKIISFTLGTRLKELRQKQGLSHVQLSNQLKDKYGISVSRDSLMAYEVADDTRSKADKLPNLGMRVEYLYCLADFYGVSLDYLLGVSDYRGPLENEQTLQSLDIPERFITEMLFFKNNPEWGTTEIQRLFGNDNFWEAVARICVLSGIPPVKYNSAESVDHTTFRMIRQHIAERTNGELTVGHTGYFRSGVMFEIQEYFLRAAAQSARPLEAKQD